jgi:hypothetical protein
MVDITEISAVVAAVGVLIGVVYYVLDMRHQRQERQTDLLVRVVPWINIGSNQLQAAIMRTLKTEYKDYEDFVKRYGEVHSEKPEQAAILALVNYFEGLGILVRRKLIDIDLVYDFWGSDINMIWDKLKPIIEGERKKWNYPTLNCEYFYSEMKKREKKLQQSKA